MQQQGLDHWADLMSPLFGVWPRVLFVSAYLFACPGSSEFTKQDEPSLSYRLQIIELGLAVCMATSGVLPPCFMYLCRFAPISHTNSWSSHGHAISIISPAQTARARLWRLQSSEPQESLSHVYCTRKSCPARNSEVIDSVTWDRKLFRKQNSIRVIVKLRTSYSSDDEIRSWTGTTTGLSAFGCGGHGRWLHKRFPLPLETWIS